MSNKHPIAHPSIILRLLFIVLTLQLNFINKSEFKCALWVVLLCLFFFFLNETSDICVGFNYLGVCIGQHTGVCTHTPSLSAVISISLWQNCCHFFCPCLAQAQRRERRGIVLQACNHTVTAGEAGTGVLLSFTLILKQRSVLPIVQVRGHRRPIWRGLHLQCSWLLYHFPITSFL